MGSSRVSISIVLALFSVLSRVVCQPCSQPSNTAVSLRDCSLLSASCATSAYVDVPWVMDTRNTIAVWVRSNGSSSATSDPLVWSTKTSWAHGGTKQGVALAQVPGTKLLGVNVGTPGDGDVCIFACECAYPGSATPCDSQHLHYNGVTVPIVFDGAWHHVVVIIDFALRKLCLYIDGLSIGCVSMPTAFTQTAVARDPLVLGNDLTRKYSAQNLNQTLDGLKIWRVALSHTQIEALFGSNSPSLPLASLNCSFDGGVASSAVTSLVDDTGVVALSPNLVSYAEGAPLGAAADVCATESSSLTITPTAPASARVGTMTPVLITPTAPASARVGTMTPVLSASTSPLSFLCYRLSSTAKCSTGVGGSVTCVRSFSTLPLVDLVLCPHYPGHNAVTNITSVSPGHLFAVSASATEGKTIVPSLCLPQYASILSSFSTHPLFEGGSLKCPQFTNTTPTVQCTWYANCSILIVQSMQHQHIDLHKVLHNITISNGRETLLRYSYSRVSSLSSLQVSTSGVSSSVPATITVQNTASPTSGGGSKKGLWALFALFAIIPLFLCCVAIIWLFWHRRRSPRNSTPEIDKDQVYAQHFNSSDVQTVLDNYQEAAVQEEKDVEKVIWPSGEVAEATTSEDSLTRSEEPIQRPMDFPQMITTDSEATDAVPWPMVATQAETLRGGSEVESNAHSADSISIVDPMSYPAYIPSSMEANNDDVVPELNHPTRTTSPTPRASVLCICGNAKMQRAHYLRHRAANILAGASADPLWSPPPLFCRTCSKLSPETTFDSFAGSFRRGPSVASSANGATIYPSSFRSAYGSPSSQPAVVYPYQTYESFDDAPEDEELQRLSLHLQSLGGIHESLANLMEKKKLPSSSLDSSVPQPFAGPSIFPPLVTPSVSPPLESEDPVNAGTSSEKLPGLTVPVNIYAGFATSQ